MSSEPLLPSSLDGLRVHLVGAKGTGMAALAEILSARGARLSGSDVADVFYTDAILKALGVRVSEGFDAAHVPADAALVIHSAAYPRDANPELIEASRRGLQTMSYPEALGALSRLSDSSGIAGVHGKTTTTAMTGSIIAALGLPATVLAGSAVSSFGGRSTVIGGERYFIAETCEYRRHFLSFRPSRIVLTSIESDHQDYYPTYSDIYAAFLEYIRLLPEGGELIYCADDPGAASAARVIGAERPDLRLVPYGEAATGPYRLLSYKTGEGEARFSLIGFETEFLLRLPGRHLALDACAALALSFSVLSAERRSRGREGATPSPSELQAAREALSRFGGSKRRSEILGEAGGVLFMDDYGHHPTAIRETIRGIKAFWPGRRLVVDFMSHTYSRTKALFGDFGASLDEADAIVMHGIYASARETPDPQTSGRALFEATRQRLPSRPGYYFETVLKGEAELEGFLRPGDLFLTMGAGDNWKLGRALYESRLAAERAGR
jgi:UDP-N-acetylmuramate--alanine ligase